jgi:acyl-CoA synthetase (AMP-forming)/AMP-acid ligase II
MRSSAASRPGSRPHGIGRNDRVVLLADNSLEHLAVFLGALS